MTTSNSLRCCTPVRVARLRTNQRDAETILLTVSHLLILCDRRYDWLLRDIIRGNITKVNVTRQISLSLFAQHDGWHNLNLLGMM